MAVIIRTIEINDLSPLELAALFTEMEAEPQARFLSEIWRIARAWPGAGWCQQSCAIVGHLDADGRDTIKTLAAHLEEN